MTKEKPRRTGRPAEAVVETNAVFSRDSVEAVT